MQKPRNFTALFRTTLIGTLAITTVSCQQQPAEEPASLVIRDANVIASMQPYHSIDDGRWA